MLSFNNYDDYFVVTNGFLPFDQTFKYIAQNETVSDQNVQDKKTRLKDFNIIAQANL